MIAQPERRAGRCGRAAWAMALVLMLLLCGGALAGVLVQEPPDTDGVDTDGDGIVDNDNVYLHMAASDGFVTMADGKSLYTFGFSQVSPPNDDSVMMRHMLKADFPAPTIRVREGQRVYLTLTNAGMIMRPDLFDAHTIHWHGFPNAASVFDGVPDASISINMGSSLTYFYIPTEPGTYMWHCHFEATEHMQMGMLGQLCVLPKQDFTMGGTYLYNDGDGSTEYDRDYLLQFGGFDPNFHDMHIGVQPLPFAEMVDRYPLLNGRGYPDTLSVMPILNENGYPSAKINSRVIAMQGDRVALRLSSLSTTDYFTLTALGLSMHVVGRGARLLRGPDGEDTSYMTNSVTLGGGEAVDVIVDTAGVAPGTYYLFTTNMDELANDQQDFGGVMTEFVVVGADGEGEVLRAVSPADGDSIVTNDAPTFSWYYAGLRDMQYAIEILGSSDPAGPVALAFDAGTEMQYTLAAGEWTQLMDFMGSQADGSFYWRVTATSAADPPVVSDINHVGGAWGLLVLSTPADASMIDAFNAPTFTFFHSGPDLARYIIQIADNDSFAGRHVLSLTQNTAAARTLTTGQWRRVKTWFPRNSDPAGWAIYWRVLGQARTGRLTTVAQTMTAALGVDPGVVTLVGPADASMVSLAGALPEFAWADTLPAWSANNGRRGKYYVQFSTTDQFVPRWSYAVPLRGTGDDTMTVDAGTWGRVVRRLGIANAAGPSTVYWRILSKDMENRLALPSAQSWTVQVEQ